MSLCCMQIMEIGFFDLVHLFESSSKLTSYEFVVLYHFFLFVWPSYFFYIVTYLSSMMNQRINKWTYMIASCYVCTIVTFSPAFQYTSCSVYALMLWILPIFSLFFMVFCKLLILLLLWWIAYHGKWIYNVKCRPINIVCWKRALCLEILEKVCCMNFVSIPLYGFTPFYLSSLHQCRQMF